MDRREELELQIRDLEQQIIELQRQYNILKSAYSILLEEYAKVEDVVSRLSRSLELSMTPLVSPLHIIELQSRGSTKDSRSKLDDLISKVVDNIFKDYKEQFRGEG